MYFRFLTLALSALAVASISFSYWTEHFDNSNLYGDTGALTDRSDQTFAPAPRAPKPAAPAPVKAAERAMELNPVVVNSIRYYNEASSYAQATDLAHLIQTTAKRYNVDPLLVTALVSQESAFRPEAVSPVGAIGLGQLMPLTAQDLGVNPWDPAENLDGCVRYLAQNLERWRDTDIPVALALASYNAGPGAVSYYGGIPPYDETRHYVRTIRSRYKALRARHLAYQRTQRAISSS